MTGARYAVIEDFVKEVKDFIAEKKWRNVDGSDCVRFDTLNHYLDTLLEEND